MDRALALLLWNMEIGAAMHPMLQCFEISVRNRFSDALKSSFGENWHHRGHVRSWSKKIDRNLDVAISRCAQNASSADDVLAKLSLGFWHDLIKNCDDVFYDKYLKNRFTPVLKSVRPRRNLTSSIGKITELRNKAYHHKPLIKQDLKADYDLMVNFVKRLSPHTWRLVHKKLSFESYLKRKP